MQPMPSLRVGLVLGLLGAGVFFCSRPANAQMIDFGRIDSFESMGTGTQRGGATPKTIIDDGEWHTVLFTILDSSTDAKIYWRSPDGDQTTIIHGPTVKAFQTAGTFKVEALSGNENQSFRYGYVLFRLKNNRGT